MKALGAWGAIAAAGATVGVVAGGLITRYLGWQYIFYLNVPIGALVLLLIPRFVPESRLETAQRHFDPFGAVTVTGGLLGLVYALAKAPQDGWGATSTVALLAAACAWGAETRSSCRDGRVFVDEAAEEVVPLDATSALLRRA